MLHYRNTVRRTPRVRPPRKRMWVYRRGSRGAGNLARALGIKIIKHEGSNYRARPGDKIVNWGDSN